MGKKPGSGTSENMSPQDIAALRACLDYVLEDAAAMGAHVTALHIRIAIKELEDFAGKPAGPRAARS